MEASGFLELIPLDTRLSTLVRLRTSPLIWNLVEAEWASRSEQRQPCLQQEQKSIGAEVSEEAKRPIRVSKHVLEGVRPHQRLRATLFLPFPPASQLPSHHHTSSMGSLPCLSSSLSLRLSGLHFYPFFPIPRPYQAILFRGEKKQRFSLVESVICIIRVLLALFFIVSLSRNVPLPWQMNDPCLRLNAHLIAQGCGPCSSPDLEHPLTCTTQAVEGVDKPRGALGGEIDF